MDIGPFGIAEVLFIGLLALVLLGPRRLPDFARRVGAVVTTLRRGTEELRRTFQDEMERSGMADTAREVRATTQELRQARDNLTAAGRDLIDEGQKVVGVVRDETAVARDAVAPAGPSEAASGEATSGKATSGEATGGENGADGQPPAASDDGPAHRESGS